MKMRTCSKCGRSFGPSGFIPTRCQFFQDSVLPICRYCLTKEIKNCYNTSADSAWNYINKIMQWADIPFIPEVWEDIYEGNEDEALITYCNIYQSEEHKTLDWTQYNEMYRTLQERNNMLEGLPKTKQYNYDILRNKWGHTYDEEQLDYLENFHNGLMNTQNVTGTLGEDQSLKLSKISLKIDELIRDGLEFDKELKSYDNLIKIAGFTPKNSKNGSDFDSVGEVGAYLEKTGWINKYYDGAIRDEVDNTMKDIQNWCRRLYVNENGIGEEIAERIQQLKLADQENHISGFDDFENYSGTIDNNEIIEEFEVDIDE